MLRGTQLGWWAIVMMIAVSVVSATVHAGDTPPCGEPGTGDCFSGNGTPGCEDSVCCDMVCTADPFCCETSWDQLCADAAIEDCVLPGTACCLSDLSCLEVTNADDCEKQGGTLAAIGQPCSPNLCVCGDPDAGSCFFDTGSAGCREGSCCESVCLIDPFCCDHEWNATCADLAITTCGFVSTACCLADQTCIEVDVPSTCQSMGGVLGVTGDACTETDCICGNPASGSCFAPNGTPGCDDGSCCDAVCDLDPFCCSDPWDQDCANLAVSTCEDAPSACCLPDLSCTLASKIGCMAMGGEYQGENTPCANVQCVCSTNNLNACFEENATGGCLNASCCQQVCAIEPFCCDTVWDAMCAGIAMKTCMIPGSCGVGIAGSCFISNGSSGCDDADCCATVCEMDNFCCNTNWDTLCAETASMFCGPVGACCLPSPDGSTSCILVAGPVACNALGGGVYQGDFTVCAATCTIDASCASDCVPINADRSFGNGEVNIDDLVEVILVFGDCPQFPEVCPCDSTPVNEDGSIGNGVVNVDDLTNAIIQFGDCVIP
ncbi:MAG: hypothetical protein AAF432_08490 [Planctomycetota bacterium]